jgi:hypothetical protein
MSLQTIITATLCAVIVVGTVGIFRKVYPETKGAERVVIVVVCCFLISAMLYLLCRTLIHTY